MGIVESKGPITVPATVIAVNKHSFRADLPRLCQTATGRHKNGRPPLTEQACLWTAFQSGLSCEMQTREGLSLPCRVSGRSESGLASSQGSSECHIHERPPVMKRG